MQRRSSGSASVPRVIATAVLVVGVSLTAGLAQRASNRESVQARFRAAAERTISLVQARMRVYEYELRGARGAIIGAGGESISRGRFAEYCRSRDLASEFPASLGQGFVRRVASADEAVFVAAARRDDWPHFAIRQLAPHGGERFVIQYLEPAEPNLPAIGLDIASEPRRRAAALAAMASGKATMTAPIALTQLRGSNRLGFLLLLPVYRGARPPATAEERDHSTFGWVFTPLSVVRVFEGFNYDNGELDMSIVDVTAPEQPIAAFSSVRAQRHAGGPALRERVRVFGRDWQVEIAARPLFFSRLRLPSSLLMGFAVAAATGALACGLWAYAWHLERRQRLRAVHDQNLRDAQEATTRLNQQLEVRVRTRTEELGAANAKLEAAAEELRSSEAELLHLNRLLAERSAQAESASHAKSMFLANMSHEIRTPLGAITGVTHLLAKTPLLPAQKDLLRTIERSTKTLLGMINDILDLSKIEAQQLTLDASPFQLSQVLDELEGVMMGYAGGKNLSLVIDPEPGLPERLVGDRVRLMQILTNLAGNAIKFADHGVVRVAVRRTAQDADRVWLRFEVHDEGPGIGEELLPKLFTPFTQAERAGATRVGGTGLGLAIVKQLATLMGGQVGVISTPGTGSQFWCTVPFTQAAEQTHGTHSTQEVGAAATSGESVQRLVGVRLLVVDDSDINRELAAQILELEGAEVATACDGEEAVQRVLSAERAYDAVLMDVQMPRVDGIEAARRIRGTRGQRELPIIALTAGALASERQQALAAGMDDFVSKPFDPETLIHGVRLHVERARGVPLGVASASDARRRKGDWSRVEGIDADDAYVRLGGDARLFRSLLARLLKELEELSRSLSLPLRASPELAARVHKLRGMAGNLGARDLHARAGEVEAALRAERVTDLQDCTARLLAECDRLDRSAREFLRASLPSLPAAQGETPKALDPAGLATLVRYLREQDLRALTLFSALSAALAQRLGAAEHARLAAALESLEFATAAELLAKLAATVEAAPTGTG